MDNARSVGWHAYSVRKIMYCIEKLGDWEVFGTYGSTMLNFIIQYIYTYLFIKSIKICMCVAIYMLHLYWLSKWQQTTKTNLLDWTNNEKLKKCASLLYFSYSIWIKKMVKKSIITSWFKWTECFQYHCNCMEFLLYPYSYTGITSF